MTDNLLGWQDARIFDPWSRRGGTVVEWAPLTAAMNDVLVRYDDGSECWVSTHTLRPILADGSPDERPRQTRQQARKAADEVMYVQLRDIRSRLVSDWHKPWPGCEFGKAIVGRAIDAAMQDIKR